MNAYGSITPDLLRVTFNLDFLGGKQQTKLTNQVRREGSPAFLKRN